MQENQSTRIDRRVDFKKRRINRCVEFDFEVQNSMFCWTSPTQWESTDATIVGLTGVHKWILEFLQISLFGLNGDWRDIIGLTDVHGILELRRSEDGNAPKRIVEKTLH